MTDTIDVFGDRDSSWTLDPGPWTDFIMLKVRNITTYYGRIHILKGVSIHVGEGEIVALIGANGAGKTTTMRLITRALEPDSGTIEMIVRRPADLEREEMDSVRVIGKVIWSCRELH